MKTILRRVRGRRGETLLEAMVSILIFTLSSVLLFTMINSASRINAAAKESDGTWAAQLSAAETGENADTMTWEAYLYEGTSNSNLSSWEVDALREKGNSDALYAYYRFTDSGNQSN